jgi:hypothetical protein
MRIRCVMIVAVSVAGICGCMSETKVDASRKSAYSYDCSGPGKGWGDCLDQARAQCGEHGYNMISQTGDAADSGKGGTEMKRVLVIGCK